MPRFNAGSATLGVVPSLQGFRQALTTELRKINVTHAVEITPDVSGFAEKLRAELQRVQATVRIPVEADLTGFAEQLRAHLAALPQQSVHVRVELDTDRSALVGLRTQVAGERLRAKLDLDTAGARAALRGLGTAVGVLGKTAGAAFGALGAQAAVGGLVAVAGAAAQAAGALALLPALGAAALAPISALVVGSEGLGDAFSAAGKASTGAGAAAGASASAQRAAARQVENAQRGVETATRQVSDAERDLARAQAATLKAQEDLNRARQQAVEDLQELNEQLAGAGLDEEAAVLAVERAQERLNEVKAEGSAASELDRREADLGYRQALQNLAEAKDRNAELAAQVEAANTAGVEGSERVISAKDAVTSAVEAEQDAQRNLADANRNVGDAQRDLADAVLSASEAITSQAGGANELNTALAKLSPSALAFFNAVQSLKPAFDNLRLDVQERLFAGIGSRVQELGSNYLPVLSAGLGGLAGLLNSGFADTLDVLNQASSLADVGTIFDNITTGFAGANAAAGPFAQAMLDLTTVGSTFLPQLGAGLGAVVGQIAEFIARTRDSGELSEFIQTAIDTLGQLGTILGNVGSIIYSVFSAGSEVGGGFLNTLGEITGRIADFLSSVEGQTALQTFFTAVGEAVRALAPIITLVADIVLTTLGPALAQLATLLAPIAGVLLEALGAALQQIAPLMPRIAQAISAIVAAFLPLLPVIGNLITALLPPLVTIIEFIAPLIAQWASIIATALTQALVGLTPLIGQLAEVLFPAMQQVLAALMPVFPQLVAAFLAIVTALLPLIPPLIQIAMQLIPVFIEILNAIIPVVASVIQTFAPFIEQILTNAIPAFQTMGDVFSGLATLINDAWFNVVKPIFDFLIGGVGTIGEAFSGLSDLAGRVWGTIGETIVNAINGVIEFINGFLDAINSIAETVGIDLNLHIDPISTLPQGGNAPTGTGTTGGGGTTRRAAEGGLADDGGRVSGIGSGDHIRALLEPDEIVIRKRYAIPYRNFLLALNNGQPEALQAAGGRQAQGPSPLRLARGGSVADALAFARQQQGKPYIWGGVGPTGYDCSGFMSDIANTIAGTALHARRFATSAMTGGRDAGGFVRGTDGAFTIGVDPGSHTAGTLGGSNVESGSGHGPMVDGRALGTDSGFAYKYYFPGAGAFRAALGDIAQAIADPIMGSITGLGGALPLTGLLSGFANHGIQTVVDYIAGVDATQYSATGGDPGRPEPAGVRNARTALRFDEGGFLPAGYSTIYNGTGGLEPLMRIKDPMQLPAGMGDLVGMEISGRLELGGDGWVRLVDGRIDRQVASARRSAVAAAAAAGSLR